jgi:hypothetical protein
MILSHNALLAATKSKKTSVHGLIGAALVGAAFSAWLFYYLSAHLSPH